MSKDNLYNHLVSDVPNVEEFRDFVKMVNKMAKQSNSIWKLGIRYRKPKEGHKYGYGGNLKCENANAFSIYVHDRRPYSQIPENQYRGKLWEENRLLEEENERLKKELAIYNNPYIDWSISSIEDEIFEVKEKIIERFLACDNDLELLKHNALKTQYDQLLEALEYAEQHD
tara:strand:+ start:1160 stop:1672 length:513 start_codon:yes stop_codon:yes gene_type:complete